MVDARKAAAAARRRAQGGLNSAEGGADSENLAIYQEDVVRTLKQLLSPGQISSRCRDVAIELKNHDEEGHLAPLCSGLESMLPVGIAFDKLDFSSSMARDAIFTGNLQPVPDRVAVDEEGDDGIKKKKKKIRDGIGSNRVLTKLQYEMLLKQQQQREQQDGPIVDVAVDDDASPSEKHRQKRGGATKAIGKLVRKISNKIASSARESVQT